MDPRQKLIEALIEKQRLLNLTLEQFAAKLNVKRSTWDFVRKGVNTPGVKVLAGALKAFPDLEPEILEFLETYSHENNNDLMAS